MDEFVIKFYRRLLREDFPNAGVIQQPTIFIEAIGEKLINCGNTGNYMQLFLRLEGQRIAEIKYRCACEPVANVAVEVLCSLVTGKTLDEAASLGEEPFYQAIGSQEDALRKKVAGLLELLREGIAAHLHGTPERDAAENKLNWDGTLSIL